MEILVHVKRFLLWFKIFLRQQYNKEGNNFTIKIIMITTSTWSKQFLEQQLHDETNHNDDTIIHDFCIINYDCNFKEKIITGTLIFASKVG